jgi:hypothetical protein
MVGVDIFGKVEEKMEKKGKRMDRGDQHAKKQCKTGEETDTGSHTTCGR